MTSNYREN